jgi:2,4-dienoyl-CoA reductase-like NADH-dependent reductase (Old Yellow Enzyme family)
MDAIFQSYELKGNIIKNRIVFPPVVCFHYAGMDGVVTQRNIDHYKEVSENGPGIIIAEATAVCEDGRLAPFQLGIWSDQHIDGMGEIARVVRSSGSLALLQIHHAGLVTPESVHPVAKAPSVDEKNQRSAELTIEEIHLITEAFINGAVRAMKAGFHGIELHGAHGYLLNQFASSLFNHRGDEYGGTLEKNLRFAREIITGIRGACGEGFIIGYRLGANSPTLEDGVRIARMLRDAGVDLLHVSHGGNLQNLPRPPKDFDYNWIVYSGVTVHNSVDIPVIVVNEIKTRERANWLIENNLTDFVAIGRPQLADPHWVNALYHNQAPNPCLSCKPKCRWYEESSLCPARRKAANVHPEIT